MKNYSPIPERYFIRAILMLFLSLVVIVKSATPQPPTVFTPMGGITPAGLAPGKSSVSDVESISLFNGSVNAAVPLLNVGGRGNAGYTIYEPIERLQWYVRSEFGYYCAPEGCPMTQPYASFTPGGGRTVEIRHVAVDWEEDCAGISGFTTTNTVVVFRRPDGSEQTLFDERQGGNEAVKQCFPYSYDSDRGRIFTARDGSELTFISDSPKSDRDDENANGESSGTGYLKTKDGTVYRITGGQIDWIRDRNGNTTTFSYDGLPSRLTKVTDSNGREIRFVYGSGYKQIIYDGTNGDDRTIQINYSTIANRLLPTPGYCGGGVFEICSSSPGPWFPSHPFSSTVVSTITLPDGRSYEFHYNEYGEIARITTPTGAKIEYVYGVGHGEGPHVYPSGWIGNPGLQPGTYPSPKPYIYRRLKERREFADGVTESLRTRYTDNGRSGWGFSMISSVTVEQVDPATNEILSKTRHTFSNSPITSLEAISPNAWPINTLFEGREIKTENLDPTTNTVLAQTEVVWDFSFCGAGRASCSPPYDQWAPYRKSVTTSILESSSGNYLVAKKEFANDKYNNVTEVKEYDFGVGQAGPLLRRSTTTYETSSQYTDTLTSPHLLALLQQSSVYDAAGNKVSLTNYEYDNYASDSTHAPLIDRSNISGHDLNYGTGFTTRGNLTKVTSYADAQNQTGAVSAYSQYDIAGNVVKAIDAKGNASTISYNDNFGVPDAEARSNAAPSALNGQQTFAFATSATNPIGYTGYSQYDYYTGAGVDAEDLNGNVNTTFYNDVLDRPTQTIMANNRPQFRKQSSIVYNDINRKTTVTSDSKVYNDNLIKAESFYDKMGRTFETRQYETTSEYVVGLSEYDSLGRAFKSSTPHRPHLNEQPQWTTSMFDSLGRVTQVKTPDNAIVSRSYSGTTTTVTDQSLRKRSGTSDALGRLLKVVEDPNGLNYETTYIYDVLGRLRKTTQTEGQTTQNRYFMYNDLGRLIRAKQVEQNPNANLGVTDPITGNSTWSVGYNYDNNGNVVSTTDANNRTITGSYDNLNRLILRDYSEPSMADVTFTFDDPAIANSKAQLTAVTSSVSSTRYTTFDELGRIKSSKQTTNGTDYNFPDYTYDLAGALVSQTYPSGRVVEIETDDIGRLSKVTGQVPGQVERTYISNIAYTSFGAVKHARLGNGRWESAQFDSKRLQTRQIGLGTSQGDTSLLKIEYDFGTTDNNGGLRQQKVTVPGAANPIVQNYAYDMLNRLQSATETVNSQVAWKQTFSYDRFGNRRFDAANTTTLPADNNIYNPQIDPVTNRFTVAEGYNYDSDGNLTSNPEDQLFTYDAENRQTEVENTVSQTTANYFYDGNGKRIRKIVGQEETVFVYDAFGKLVAEYSTEISPDPKISYLTTDNLGSPRIVTDQFGQVVARHDYLPFGEEVMAGVGGRTTNQGFGGDDGVRQQFTGYERDDESGLDFAQARYFKGGHGRFTSVDPLAASANIKNPQSLNRYSYALNSPYKFTDPLGLAPTELDGGEVDCLSCWDIRPLDCPPGSECDENGEVIEKVHSPYDPTTAVPGCGEKTTDECSQNAKQPPSAGFVGPVPVQAPPTTAPATAPGGSSTAGNILKNVGRTALITVAAPLAIILALPRTTHAPGPPTSTQPDDRKNDPLEIIFRVSGGNARDNGEWWTPVDPRTVPNYRSAASLPPSPLNTGERLVEGTVRSSNIIYRGVTLPQMGGTGGTIEYRVRRGSVTITKITSLVPNL